MPVGVLIPSPVTWPGMTPPAVVVVPVTKLEDGPAPAELVANTIQSYDTDGCRPRKLQLIPIMLELAIIQVVVPVTRYWTVKVVTAPPEIGDIQAKDIPLLDALVTTRFVTALGVMIWLF